ncbi:MAG: SDR family oxidoreductase [Halopseudomonas aestusnigri]
MSTWLISGASGLLGHALCRHLRDNGNRVIGLKNSHAIDLKGIETIEVDLVQSVEPLETLIRNASPDVVVHAAGLTSVDGCESQEDLASLLHADVSASMARAALECSAKMVYISTDHLWRGLDAFVTEQQQPEPLNAYARTKLAGEIQTLAINPKNLVVRTNFFGKGLAWRQSFSDWVLNSLSSRQEITAFTDAYFTPISLHYLCLFLEKMVEGDACGVYNVAGSERVSKFDFAVRIAKAFGLDESLIKTGQLGNANLKALRPLDMSLSVEKVEQFLGQNMPDLALCFDSLNAE